MDVHGDSTGKSKIAEAKAKNRNNVLYFFVGLCFGIIISERVYVSHGALEPLARKIVSSNKQHFFDHHESQRNMQSVSATREPVNELEAILKKIAPNKEVLVAVANKNILWGDMLGTFMSGITATNITNHLLIVLDEETHSWAAGHGFNSYLLKLEIHKAQKNTGDNHAVSAMKFGILKRFIELGYNVFLSDVDICILQNPFDHLYRDSDVEGMTDGFDENTAYGSIEGYEDPSMGWGRFAQYYKHFNMNSGLFYLRANNRTLDLMTRLETRLAKETYWDQTAYNEAIFFLSHGDYKSPQVTVRVLDIYKFMNSKVLFKDIRKRPQFNRPPMPVMVHVNYHPDKHERMLAVYRYYRDGDDSQLMAMPGGSEPGSR